MIEYGAKLQVRKETYHGHDLAEVTGDLQKALLVLVAVRNNDLRPSLCYKTLMNFCLNYCL